MSRFKRVLPFFIIGPISGPLLAGVVFNLRDKRFVLSGLYGFALLEYSFLLPSLLAKYSISAGQVLASAGI